MGSAPEPINLEELRLEAESADGDRTVVGRDWLKRVHAELSAARRAKAALDEVFGEGWVLK